MFDGIGMLATETLGMHGLHLDDKHTALSSRVWWYQHLKQWEEVGVMVFLSRFERFDAFFWTLFFFVFCFFCFVFMRSYQGAKREHVSNNTRPWQVWALDCPLHDFYRYIHTSMKNVHVYMRVV
jgi:hypothetical protein